MSKAFWVRIGSAVAGAAALVVSVLVPPAAAILGPLGGAAIGYAIKAPGTVSVAKLQEKATAAASAAAGAAADAVAANAGRPAAIVATAAGTAAASAAVAEIVRK